MQAVRARRDAAGVEAALAALKAAAAHDDQNLMPNLLACARVHATEGEIVQALRTCSAPTPRPRLLANPGRNHPVRKLLLVPALAAAALATAVPPALSAREITVGDNYFVRAERRPDGHRLQGHQGQVGLEGARPCTT